MTLDFRERLLKEADEAFSHICMHENYDEGLGITGDILEEFFAEEIAKVIEPLLLGMSNDLSSVSKGILVELQEFRSRRKAREKADKVQDDQIARVVERAQEAARNK